MPPFARLVPTYAGLRRFGVRLALNLAVATAGTLLFLLPDLVWRAVSDVPGLGWYDTDIAYVALFFIFSRFVANTRWTIALAAVMFLLGAAEMAHHAFIGAWFGPYDVALAGTEYEDLLAALGVVASRAWPAFLIMTCGFGMVAALLRVSSRWAWRTRAGYFMLAFWVAIPFVHAVTEDNSMRFNPDVEKTAFRNGMNAVSYYLVWGGLFGTGHGRVGHAYAAYEVAPDASAGPPPYNIVVIMGESITYRHMSLFGYERPTTPFLDSLRGKPGFVARRAISSGVSTHVSLPMFFNVQYEPDNRYHPARGTGNLFRLARQRGYQTAFLSRQRIKGTSGLVSQGSVDHWEEEDTVNQLPGTFDARLIEALRRVDLDWSAPVFLTMNPRTGHIAYDDYYPSDAAVFKPRGDSWAAQQITAYDNAMHYFDSIVQHIVETVRARSARPTVFILTSDHGERLSQEDGFGHNTLEVHSAEVPFVLYSPERPDLAHRVDAELSCVTTHYNIGKAIQRLLGYDLDNPNEQPGLFYINGVDLYGAGGFKVYRRNGCPPAAPPIHFVDAGLPPTAQLKR